MATHITELDGRVAKAMVIHQDEHDETLRVIANTTTTSKMLGSRVLTDPEACSIFWYH